MAGSDLSPASKRLKTLAGAQTPGRLPQYSSKGKEKVLPEQDKGAPTGDVEANCSSREEREEKDAGSGTCGICFTEEGQRSIRGRIDSCDHYFCFVCIMEWSKVESRCPLCKQRFCSISRGVVPGLFDTERVVAVPMRNQVYHPLGVQTEVYEDPYAETCCCECGTSEDEYLLLLCDLCDSAIHTYCGGLGFRVPEGDWFCDDCTLTKLKHSESDSDEPQKDSCGVKGKGCSQEVYRNLHHGRKGERNSSLYNQEQHQDQSDRHRLSNITCSTSNRHSDQNKPTSNSSAEKASPSEIDVSARTVRRCRDVGQCIRRFRENWDSLRTGSLCFKSASSISNTTRRLTTNNGKKKVDARPSKKTEVSCNRTEPTDTSVSNNLTSSIPKDVDRAWKMMEAAISVQNRQSGSSSKCQTSSHPRQMGISKEVCIRSSHITPAAMEPLQCKVQIDDGGLVSRNRPMTVRSSSNCELQIGDLSIDNRAQKIEGRIQINNKEEQVPCRIQKSHARSENRNPPNACGSLGNSEVRKTLEEKTEKPSLPENDSSKSEIQSLVKLNLKLLQVNRPLGADVFKRVAKISTHTILAACGMEHSKSSTRPFPDVICNHSEVRPFQRSNLMPVVCRKCFYAFVKDVVNNVVSEHS